MDMVDISMLMAAIISEIGWMVKDLDGENMLTSLERFKKECGNTLNLLVTEIFIQFSKLFNHLLKNTF